MSGASAAIAGSIHRACGSRALDPSATDLSLWTMQVPLPLRQGGHRRLPAVAPPVRWRFRHRGCGDATAQVDACGDSFMPTRVPPMALHATTIRFADRAYV